MFEFYPLSHSTRTCISLHSTLEKNPVSTFYLSRVERKSENISFTVFKFDLEYLLAPQSYHVNNFILQNNYQSGRQKQTAVKLIAMTYPWTIKTLLLENSHRLSLWLRGGQPSGHPWWDSLGAKLGIISTGSQVADFYLIFSLGLTEFSSWELLSVTSSLTDCLPARDLTECPPSSSPGWDELVIKFQRQLGYDPSVSTFFSCSVSGLQCPGSTLRIILHCPSSQTSESGVTVEIYWLLGQLGL